MSTIRVRKLDENWDPVYGDGQNDYVFDLDAVIQIIQTRLKLWLAEWWEDLNEGLPMIEKILGKTDKALIDRLIQKRVQTTLPGIILKIKSYSSSFDSSTRAYSCTMHVDTIFGTIAVTNTGGGLS
jgi:hypothetical protein